MCEEMEARKARSKEGKRASWVASFAMVSHFPSSTVLSS